MHILHVETKIPETEKAFENIIPKKTKKKGKNKKEFI